LCSNKGSHAKAMWRARWYEGEVKRWKVNVSLLAPGIRRALQMPHGSTARPTPACWLQYALVGQRGEAAGYGTVVGEKWYGVVGWRVADDGGHMFWENQVETPMQGAPSWLNMV